MSKAINSQPKKDLTVKGETIERLYINYITENYTVNRRYQRKLVWSIEEKIAFIDSIAKKYPVPIILLAEDIASESIEIIDGMQRMNAIFSFIEGEFSIAGQYFDLESMASTKELLDSGKLTQRLPKIPRTECVKITAYEVPISVFEFNSKEDVDEVFRRINSGGRKLSRQELRAAGSLEDFATAVRKISSSIRGDASHSDILPLNTMKLISVATKELGYGINVDEVFWVKQGILSKEDVRQSLDEEIITDILSYVLLAEKPSSRREFLDDYFGSNTSEASTRRKNEVNLLVRKETIDKLTNQFLKITDLIKKCSISCGTPLTTILFGAAAQQKAPRVFQIVFIALYELVIEQNMRAKDIVLLSQKLEKAGPKIQPQEGGRWGADHRKDQIAKFKKSIKTAFSFNDENDPADNHWISKLENLLTQSLTEQPAYDFKQGFINLAPPFKFDDKSFEKILKTCVGIANLSANSKGYVIIGVADSIHTNQQLKKQFDVDPIEYNYFSICGINHELSQLKFTPDQYAQYIVEKIRASKLSDSLCKYILRNINNIEYKDRTVYIIEVASQGEPSYYDEQFYIREGANLRELKPTEVAQLGKRFEQERNQKYLAAQS